MCLGCLVGVPPALGCGATSCSCLCGWHGLPCVLCVCLAQPCGRVRLLSQPRSENLPPACVCRFCAHSLGVSWSVLSNRVPMSSLCLQAAPTEDYPKQVTKTTPTHPDVHTDRPTHSYTLRHTPGLPPAHRRQLSLCATKSKGPSGGPLTAHEDRGLYGGLHSTLVLLLLSA